MADDRSALVQTVRSQAADRLAWERAETHLVDVALRQRLTSLGVEPTTDVGVALMATAMLLAEGSPEFGGDFRDALAEVAHVGLALLAAADEGDCDC
ncbi:MAG: hypothetical protein HYX34_07055 [Actinobacteria bacterium]|nr:hypothetical protein [Actinomycetota bacterium]